jgi:hypothetical protein
MIEGSTRTEGLINLAEAKRFAEASTAQVSSNTRQLSFVGIGAVWIFSGGTSPKFGSIHIAEPFLVAGLFLVGALTFDFLQYLCASIAWVRFRREKEEEVTDQGEPDSFLAPKRINWLAYTFFWAKTPLVTVAYGFLGYAIYQRIH